jgi:peptidoglycan/LPS O-acetylase OafA/YrhL
LTSTAHAPPHTEGKPGSTVSPRFGRLGGLDGLRAIAVVAVVLFHFFPASVPGGFIGVDIFFVISGFLITGLLLAEHERSGRLDLTRFWKRRLRRLVPPIVPLVLAGCTAAWLIGGDVLIGLRKALLGATTFAYNWVAIAAGTSYFSAYQPELFRNLWSLAVEEQFYLVWPIALLGLLRIRRSGLRLGLVLGLAAASALWMAVLFSDDGGDPTRVYYGSDTHSFGLLIGAALALVLRRGRPAGPATRAATLLAMTRPWLGGLALTLVTAGFWVLPSDGGASYRGGLAVVSLLTAIVIWAGVRGDAFGRALDARPLRYLGQRSYGIYLWHWPVLVVVQLAWPASDERSLLIIGTTAGVISLLAAGCSYRWLELPIRQLGVRGSWHRLATPPPLSRHRGPRGALLAVVVVAGLLSAGTIAALASAPAAAAAQVAVARGQAALEAAERLAAAQSAEAEAARSAAAAAARVPSGDAITAVGDSVMLASAAELQSSFPGISIDAAVNRGMQSAAGMLADAAAAGTLRPVVIVALGTNGPITREELAAVETAIGPDRHLVLVNAFAEREWTATVNTTLATFSDALPYVVLANWHDAIAPRLDLLAEDRVHPGRAGGQVYADSIRSALQALAADR